MESILVVTTPASDLQLLTIEEMRLAAGLASDDSSQDTALQARGLAVAAAIAEECNVAVGRGGEPTLLQESLTETFRAVCTDELVLSRRHEVAIDSITVDDVELGETEYDVDPESGIVTRLCGDAPTTWRAGRIVAVYEAGFATVPETLRKAAIETFRGYQIEETRDPYVKATEVEIPDVERVRTELWSGSLPGQADGGLIPVAALGNLKRYRNVVV